MKLRYFILTAVTLYGMFVVVACGNKNADNTVGQQTCPQGTAYYNGGYCYNQAGQVIGTYNGSVIANQDTGYLAETMRNQNLSVSNTGIFNSFLQKAFGVCNRASITGGQANCDSWINSYFMIGLQTFASQNNSMKLTFYVDYRPTSNLQYSYQLPTGSELLAGIIGFPTFNDNTGAYIPWFQVDAVASVINGSKGFELRAYGPLVSAANRSLIQIQVNNGKILDGALNFKMFFEGKQMASGNFGRCINPTCQ